MRSTLILRAVRAFPASPRRSSNLRVHRFVGLIVAALAITAVAAVTPPVPAGAVVAFAAGAPVLVARGATNDATASNNEVKILRARGTLVIAYAGGAGGASQILLVSSRDGGVHWTPLGQASEGPVASRLAALAADPPGRLHVVWTRYDDGVGKIYYREWAPAGSPKGAAGGWAEPPRRISLAGVYAGYPAAALDRAGHPRVIWYGIRAGQIPAPTKHGSIYEIIYTGYDGSAWSPPALISNGPPDSINPALASDSAGRLHAVWYQYNGRAYQVRYALYDRGWGAPEGISRTSNDEFNPDITADEQGRLDVVWEQHDAHGSVINYARRTPSGAGRAAPSAAGQTAPSAGVWGEAVAISAEGGAGPAAPAAYHPSVAADATGAVWVAWDADDGQIYARRYKNGWSRVLRLTTDGGNTFPSVLSDAGALDVIWTHTSAAGASVYFARVTARP